MDTGEVTSVVGEQVVVKAAGRLPGMGSAVFANKGRIGLVADIIGTVEMPYFVVRKQPNAVVKVGDRTRDKGV